MNCIIIADKFNKGNKTKGWNGLLKVNKNTILINNQIRNIYKVFPKANIVYIYGFDHKRVEDYLNQHQDIHMIYNEDYDHYGEVYSIAKARAFLNDSCLIFFGDMIIQNSMFKDFSKKSHIYINSKRQGDLGCTINEHGQPMHLFYDLKNYLGNMYYISKKDIENFRSLVNQPIYKNFFLFEIINIMIERQSTFECKDVKNKKLFQTINS